MGKAAKYDNEDRAHASNSKAMQDAPVTQALQQAAQNFVAPHRPMSAGFWEDKPMASRRSRPLLERLIMLVPFVRSWGGLL